MTIIWTAIILFYIKGCCPKFATWLNVIISHSSKSIVASCPFAKMIPPWEIWQKESLITHTIKWYTKMVEFPNKNIDYGWQWPFRYWPASLNERKRTLLPFKLTLGNLQTKKHASSSWKCTWSRIAKCVIWVLELGFLKIEFTIHIHSPTDLSYNLQLNI